GDVRGCGEREKNSRGGLRMVDVKGRQPPCTIYGEEATGRGPGRAAGWAEGQMPGQGYESLKASVLADCSSWRSRRRTRRLITGSGSCRDRREGPAGDREDAEAPQRFPPPGPHHQLDPPETNQWHHGSAQ